MVDCSGLENRRGCKLTVGSNPTLSATLRQGTGTIGQAFKYAKRDLQRLVGWRWLLAPTENIHECRWP